MNDDDCTCTPRINPSVIGACACPRHGMKALMRDLEKAHAALGIVVMLLTPEQADEWKRQMAAMKVSA